MKSKYYNGVRILNANCPINFSIGNRSTGKSYYWKRYCVKQFIKNNRQFVYLRRHMNELDMSLEKFFEDISREFPNYSFEAISFKIGYRLTLTKYDAKTDTKETKICGYAFSLSTIHKVKSIPLENVDTIFYDEFIPDNQRYLKPSVIGYEPELLLSLFMTVARGYNEVIRPNVKLIACANSVSYYNPYFSYFNIDLSKQEHGIFNNVFAERVYNNVVADEIRKSKIGGIIHGTNYGNMALDNISLYDTDAHIEKHPRNSKAIMCIYFNDWYTVWLDDKIDRIYFSQSYDSTMRQKFKLCELPEQDASIPWLPKYQINLLREMACEDKIFYDNGAIKARLHGLFIPKIA